MTREYDPNEDEPMAEHHHRLMSARPEGLDAGRREAMFERIVSGSGEAGAAAGAAGAANLRVSTRRFRRTIAMAAAVTVAAAAATALPLTLGGGHSAPASGGSDLRLASYSMLLPGNYQVTSKAPNACDPPVVARAAAPFAVFAVASHGGGCVSMRLTQPYRPSGAGAPVISGVRNGDSVFAQATRVTIDKDPALLGSFSEMVSAGPAGSQLGGSVLDVMVPASAGQMQDLVLTSVGMAPATFYSYVNSNLALPPVGPVACSIPAGNISISWTASEGQIATGAAATTNPAATTTSPAAATTSTSTTTTVSPTATASAPLTSTAGTTATTTAAATTTGPAATTTSTVIVPPGGSTTYVITCMPPPPCAPSQFQPATGITGIAATTTPAAATTTAPPPPATTTAVAATTTAAAATTTAPAAATTTAAAVATTTGPTLTVPVGSPVAWIVNGECVQPGAVMPTPTLITTGTAAAETTTSSTTTPLASTSLPPATTSTPA
ncbi:MAG TPA: hypothetical protein VME46_08380 [Acidimicrobiales bacterium]|nr:hypothetical protein [Acidimicrobiales bacterium]